MTTNCDILIRSKINRYPQREKYDAANQKFCNEIKLNIFSLLSRYLWIKNTLKTLLQDLFYVHCLFLKFELLIDNIKNAYDKLIFYILIIWN